MAKFRIKSSNGVGSARAALTPSPLRMLIAIVPPIVLRSSGFLLSTKRLGTNALLTRKSEQLRRQFRAGDKPFDSHLGLRVFPQKFQISQDGGQQVIEVVSDASLSLANCVHVLKLSQLSVSMFFGRNIRRGRPCSNESTLVVELPKRRKQTVEDPPCFCQKLIIDDAKRALARKHVGPRRTSIFVSKFCRHEVGRRYAKYLAALVSEHRRPSIVDIDRARVRIGRVQRHGVRL